MSDIDIRHLQYFVAAAAAGSFVKAAKVVNVSQPAITKSIQRMEQWLGQPVFERGPELRLTEFGKALIADAKRVLDGFDDLLHTADRVGKSLAVKLRIGAGPLMAETILGEAVGRLLVRAPGVRVTVEVENYAAFPVMLRDRAIDLFVADVSEYRDAKDFDIRNLNCGRFQWFCRKGHPLAGRRAVTLAEVLAYPVALPELPMWGRRWFAENMPEGVLGSVAEPPFVPRIVCSHYSTLMQVVLKSDAVCALTESLLESEPYASRVVKVDYRGDRPSSNPGIVTLKRRALSPVAQMLMEEIAAVAEGV
jgi:DNA-binding transcriptional LysR family regulator